jgi:hypothetical protein
LFKNKIDHGIIEGEYDRMQNAMKELNANLRIVDFSGAKPEYSAQSGMMVAGIVAVITKDQRLDGNPGVAGAVIDYAGAAAERAISGGGATRDELRHLVGKMPQNLKNMLASPLNCQVWCLHQLTAKANSLAAGVAPKTTDTAEANNFFENVNFGFMVGTPRKDGTVVFTNGKQRRAARMDNIVIKIEGEYGRVVDASKQYTTTNGVITDRADASRVVSMGDRRSRNGTETRDTLFDDLRDAPDDDGIGLN